MNKELIKAAYLQAVAELGQVCLDVINDIASRTIFLTLARTCENLAEVELRNEDFDPPPPPPEAA